MRAQKPMKKYGLKVYDDEGNVLSSQDLHGSADVGMTLGHLNKNIPKWFKFTVTKKGEVNEFGN